MSLSKSRSTSSNRKTLIIFLVFVLFAALELAYNFPDVATPLEKLELSARDTTMRVHGIQ